MHRNQRQRALICRLPGTFIFTFDFSMEMTARSWKVPFSEHDDARVLHPDVRLGQATRHGDSNGAHT